MQAEVSVVLVVRYQYLPAVLPALDYFIVDDRKPEAVQCQGGAVSFDYVEINTVAREDGTEFTHLSPDPETYYWGQELSKEDVQTLPGYEETIALVTSERFVLTSWGGIIPLNNEQDIVLPDVAAFELPPDMRLDP